MRSHAEHWVAFCLLGSRGLRCTIDRAQGSYAVFPKIRLHLSFIDTAQKGLRCDARSPPLALLHDLRAQRRQRDAGLEAGGRERFVQCGRPGALRPRYLSGRGSGGLMRMVIRGLMRLEIRRMLFLRVSLFLYFGSAQGGPDIVVTH